MIAKSLGPLRDADELFDRLEAVEGTLRRRRSASTSRIGPTLVKFFARSLSERKPKKRFSRKLSEVKIYRLNTFHCRDLLRDALRDVNERLVIVSAFISSDVVNETFLHSLEVALKRGVRVWIAFGMGDRDGREKPTWQRAESALREIRERHRTSFKLMDCGKTRHRTHEKILMRDDFVVTGSFNWLSYGGEGGKNFRREDALRVTVPEIVDAYFRDVTERFDGE